MLVLSPSMLPKLALDDIVHITRDDAQFTIERIHENKQVRLAVTVDGKTIDTWSVVGETRLTVGQAVALRKQLEDEADVEFNPVYEHGSATRLRVYRVLDEKDIRAKRKLRNRRPHTPLVITTIGEHAPPTSLAAAGAEARLSNPTASHRWGFSFQVCYDLGCAFGTDSPNVRQRER